MDYLSSIIWYLKRVYWLDRDIEAYGAKPYGLPGDCLIPF